MIVFRAKLFDGYLKGTGAVYTQTADSELLGSVERVTLGLVWSAVTGTNPKITLQFENSADGTRWMNQSATPELDEFIANGLQYTTNYDSMTLPIGSHVRIRLALSGTSPAGYLRLWAIGRNPAW